MLLQFTSFSPDGVFSCFLNYLFVNFHLSPVPVEDQHFYNVSSTRESAPSPLATATSSYASLLNATGEPVGPAKVLHVQEGDKISINVKYYYETFSGSNSTIDVQNVLSNLANMFIINGSVAPTGFEGSWASSTFTSNSGSSGILSTFFNGQSSSSVLAYLAYLTYDEEFNLIEDASGILHANDDNTVNNIGILDLVIPKNGYIYIYVANESPTDVYFDNLQIQHKKSNVLELNDYFPYGLLNTQNSQTGLSLTPDNLQKYQDKEMQNALGLNTLDFGLRHYDATLGRWHVQDPMMQFMNGYLAMNNNPVTSIDPDGGVVFTSYTPYHEDKPSMNDGGHYSSLYSNYMSKSNVDGWLAGYHSSYAATGSYDIGYDNVFTDASGQTYSQRQWFALVSAVKTYNIVRSLNANGISQYNAISFSENLNSGNILLEINTKKVINDLMQKYLSSTLTASTAEGTLVAERELDLTSLLLHYVEGSGADYFLSDNAFLKLIRELKSKEKLFISSITPLDQSANMPGIFELAIQTDGTSYENTVGSAQLYLNNDSFVGYSDKWNFDKQALGSRSIINEFKTYIGSKFPGTPFWVLYGIFPPEKYRKAH